MKKTAREDRRILFTRSTKLLCLARIDPNMNKGTYISVSVQFAMNGKHFLAMIVIAVRK